jgi:hypothetical protein
VVLTVTTVCPDPVLEAGLKVQVLSRGSPEQANVTVPVKLSNWLMATLRLPVAPGADMEIEFPLELSTKSGWRLKAKGALVEAA